MGRCGPSGTKQPVSVMSTRKYEGFILFRGNLNHSQKKRGRVTLGLEDPN